jgi:CRP-like cAMP-binding protein
MQDVIGPRPTTLAAWRGSFFASLPERIRDAMLHDAVVTTVAAGHAIYEAYGPARLVLVHRGRARVQTVSREGRAVTLRYAGAGQVIGLPATVLGGAPEGADAITECEVSMLSSARMRRLAASEPAVGWLLAQQVSHIVLETAESFRENLFGSMLQRVSRHLLDLATETPDGLVVRVDQQTLAEAVGSVREVVARELRKLREESVIRRHPEGIAIVEPHRLRHVAAGRT